MNDNENNNKSKIIHMDMDNISLEALKDAVKTPEGLESIIKNMDLLSLLLVHTFVDRDIELFKNLVSHIKDSSVFFNSCNNSLNSVMFMALSNKNTILKYTDYIKSPTKLMLDIIHDVHLETKANLSDDHIDSIGFALTLSSDINYDTNYYVKPLIDETSYNKLVGSLLFEGEL